MDIFIPITKSTSKTEIIKHAEKYTSKLKMSALYYSLFDHPFALVARALRRPSSKLVSGAEE